MRQKQRLVVCDARLLGTLVIETDDEAVEDERVSSSRLRKAERAPDDEPATPEFRELRAWTRGAKLARRVG